MISVLISDPGSKIQDPRSRGYRGARRDRGGRHRGSRVSRVGDCRGTGLHPAPGRGLVCRRRRLGTAGGASGRVAVPPCRRAGLAEAAHLVASLGDAAGGGRDRAGRSVAATLAATRSRRPRRVCRRPERGARSLNAHVIEMAERLDGRAEVQILHQTGNEHEEWVRARLRSLGGSLRYVAVPFIEEMADAYACADLVVCRAGAGTLAEVTANGLPVVAVPYPYAAEGHQEANARLLESAGAAVVVLDREANGVRLAQAGGAPPADPARLRAMAMASRRLGRPQAAREVAALVVAVAERGFS